MKLLITITFVLSCIICNGQNTYTKRNELKTGTRNNIYTVYTYDELGNMKTRNVSIVAGEAQEISNELVEIEHLVTQEEVEITISDGIEGKEIRVYNEANQLVWIYYVPEYFDKEFASKLKSATSHSVTMDVTDFEAGYYYVNVFDTLGVHLARKQIEITDTTKVVETLLSSTITFFPNPTNGELSVDFGEAINQVTRLTVTDLSGKLIIKKDKSDLVENTKLNLENVISGTYLISIYADDKIIKQEKVVVSK